MTVVKKNFWAMSDIFRDSSKLNPRLFEPEANTKRKILAQTSAVFDPLSLCLPVMIKGRLDLRDLWKQKLGWDDAIFENLCPKWKVLYQGLVLLNSLEFPSQEMMTLKLRIWFCCLCCTEQ